MRESLLINNNDCAIIWNSEPKSLKSTSTVTEKKDKKEKKLDIQRNKNIIITSEKCAPFLITSVERRIFVKVMKERF